jgi:replicative DNA helicase Mcm
LAPNISGMEHIKKAAVLYMAKGVTKETVNGEKRRGFIHMLVVGDGGLAKSTILQNIQKRHYNVRLADGKDATKAGIVASVVQNKNSGKWSFEAGEIVLANDGLLLLDEVDKLPNADRQAMHRPMEQGEAVLSKASIKVTLQCNTGIFAVGNPKFGMFNKGEGILQQIDISPTLLSRFDLVYILKDEIDSDTDRIKAKKILNVHSAFEEKVIDQDLFKKYIYYISKLKPKLTVEATDRIENIYVKMRERSTKDGEKVGMPIGPRHLEGLIRLSEAHAKLRLSETVDLIDVDVAEDLFRHSLSDFGIDPDKGAMDLSSFTTTVKSGKREKYMAILTYLKDKAKILNDFIKKDVYSELSRHFNMSYSEVDEIFSMLHKEGDIYENSTNKFKVVKLE